MALYSRTRHERSFEELAPLYSESEIIVAIGQAEIAYDDDSVEFFKALLNYKKTGQ